MVYDCFQDLDPAINHYLECHDNSADQRMICHHRVDVEAADIA